MNVRWTFRPRGAYPKGILPSEHVSVHLVCSGTYQLKSSRTANMSPQARPAPRRSANGRFSCRFFDSAFRIYGVSRRHSLWITVQFRICTTGVSAHRRKNNERRKRREQAPALQVSLRYPYRTIIFHFAFCILHLRESV